MIESIATILRIPDLRNRILFTLAMLAVFRLGIFIPAPGVDRIALGDFFSTQQNTMFGLYNMFSGGALQQFSVFVLGIMPYISASIIMQMLQHMMPQFERLSKEGQQGRNKLNQYTRYLTILIAIIQSFAFATAMEQMRTQGGQDIVIEPGWSFRLLTICTVTAGSCFVMWLGEQITDRGVGNGSSLIITSGIVARLPQNAMNTFEKFKIGEINLLTSALLLAFMFGVVMAIVFVERGQRRIPIQYAKRVVGRRVYGGQATHLPIKVNVTGVVPPVFASAVLMFPATITSYYQHPLFEALNIAFRPGSWTYEMFYVAMIIFFAFFYTALTFNPVDVADNLRRQGGYVPGIRPGKQTADYLDRILNRLTTGGSIYLATVCVVPTVLVSQFGVPFYFGGTGLLIVVGVSLDTVAQIEGHLLTRHYDGLMDKKTKRVRGRRQRLAVTAQE